MVGPPSPSAETTVEPLSHETQQKTGLEQPLYYWLPSIGACGLDMVHEGTVAGFMAGRPTRWIFEF